MRKIPSLVSFHSLYQLLDSQVYHNGLKFVLINEGKSNRELPKMSASKNLQMAQKNLHTLI